MPRAARHLPGVARLRGPRHRGLAAAHFLRRGRLAVSDGRQFGAGFEQHVRINFATSRAILEQILERLATAARN